MKRLHENGRGPPAILLATTDHSTLLRLTDPPLSPLPALPRIIALESPVVAPPKPQPVADRLAAVGMLAAGLGHDVGNLLPIIRLHLDALQHMKLPDAALEDVRAISDACDYLKHLCLGLRLFVLQPENSHTTADHTDLATWWRDVAPFMRNALPRGVQFSPTSFLNLPSIAISAHALTQAVYNLVQNAGDAMAPLAHGRVDVSAASTLDGGHVVLTITDDGAGMTPEVLRQCMDPFYSTKRRSNSSGLGLALVHNAVENAGGSITIRSRLGAGTTFLLTLPIAIPSANDVPTIATSAARAADAATTHSCSMESHP